MKTLKFVGLLILNLFVVGLFISVYMLSWADVLANWTRYLPLELLDVVFIGWITRTFWVEVWPILKQAD
jgi:hypothetical protein